MYCTNCLLIDSELKSCFFIFCSISSLICRSASPVELDEHRQEEDKKGELSTTDIILIVALSVLFVVFVIIAVVYLVRKKIRSRKFNVAQLQNEPQIDPQREDSEPDPPVTIVRTVEDALRDLESSRNTVRFQVTYHL